MEFDAKVVLQSHNSKYDIGISVVDHRGFESNETKQASPLGLYWRKYDDNHEIMGDLHFIMHGHDQPGTFCLEIDHWDEVDDEEIVENEDLSRVEVYQL